MKYFVKTITAVLIILSCSYAYSEIVYMKDGQVVKGQIVAEDAGTVTVKTKYQTRVIRKNHISRIMYGDRDLEEINILMNDGSTITGYLIDQDNNKVIIRKEKTSAKEIIIKKSDIKQMSQKKIIPLYPAVSIGVGMFYPFDSKGADLDAALMVTASMGFNLTFISNTRLLIEGGYTKPVSKTADGVSFLVVPVTLNLCYDLAFSSFHVVPRMGAGLSMCEFDDGLNSPTQGYDFTFIGGLGCEYELAERTLRIGVYCNYFLLKEKEASMNSITGMFGVSYYF